jgi:hypothetical protein
VSTPSRFQSQENETKPQPFDVYLQTIAINTDTFLQQAQTSQECCRNVAFLQQNFERQYCFLFVDLVLTGFRL